MCKQYAMQFDQSTIERIAKRLNERAIFYMARRGWVTEYVSDHAIKMRRKLCK